MSTYRCRAKFGVLLAVAGALPANAQDASQKVAVCPWDIGAKARRLSDTLKTRAAEQAAVTLDAVPAADVRAALGDASCEATVESLAPLAARTHADYGLYVRAEEAGEEMVLRWMLVDRAGGLPSGGAAAQTFVLPLSSVQGQGTLDEAIRRFYVEAVLPRLSPVAAAAGQEEEPSTESLLAPLVRTPLGETSAPEASHRPLHAQLHSPVDTKVAPRARAASLHTWEWVGVGAAGAGAAVLLTSGVLALSAKDDQRELSRTLDSSGQLPDSPDSRVLLRSLQRRSSFVNGTLIGGAALLAAGALTYWLAPSREPAVEAGVVAGPSGGALHLHGRF